jgi:hypothetical protein
MWSWWLVSAADATQNVQGHYPAFNRCHAHLCHFLLGKSGWHVQEPRLKLTSQGYDVGKRIVYSLTPNRPSQSLTISELAMAGAFSAIPATLVAGPAESVKVLRQVSSVKRYLNPS